jgi:hypothetical protein
MRASRAPDVQNRPSKKIVTKATSIEMRAELLDDLAQTFRVFVDGERHERITGARA